MVILCVNLARRQSAQICVKHYSVVSVRVFLMRLTFESVDQIKADCPP